MSIAPRVCDCHYGDGNYQHAFDCAARIGEIERDLRLTKDFLMRAQGAVIVLCHGWTVDEAEFYKKLVDDISTHLNGA